MSYLIILLVHRPPHVPTMAMLTDRVIVIRDHIAVRVRSYTKHRDAQRDARDIPDYS